MQQFSWNVTLQLLQFLWQLLSNQSEKRRLLISKISTPPDTNGSPFHCSIFFFARKQIKQVCELQVQTMQDLYKKEAMPILKLWLNQFYDKSSTKPKSWRLPHQSFQLYQYNHMRTLESSLCLYFPPEPHWGCLTKTKTKKKYFPPKPQWGCLTKTKKKTKTKTKKKYFPPEPHWGCLTGAAAAIRLAQCHGTG